MPVREDWSADRCLYTLTTSVSSACWCCRGLRRASLLPLVPVRVGALTLFLALNGALMSAFISLLLVLDLGETVRNLFLTLISLTAVTCLSVLGRGVMGNK